jgi:hypothetical protein
MDQIEKDELLVEIDESQEDQAYVTYDIATYPSDYTLSGIVEMWSNHDITIPEFQREFVWTMKQSSSLIESFLLGLPVPPVFFYIDDENKNLVIDGQQRILSVIFYFDGYFGVENIQGKRQVFHLEGLDERSPFYKKTFTELSASDQRKLKGTVLRAMNVRQLSPIGENTSIYHIFSRLNTSGTPLKSQEIRNVVFRGELVQILRNLNRDENWRIILGQPTPDKHQVDVELVLRLFAFMDGASKYEKPMKEFLNKAMEKNRHGDTPKIQKFENLFPLVTKTIKDRLGQRPFHIRGRLSTSALDSVASILMQHYDSLPNDLALRYKKILKDERFSILTTIGTTDTATVKERFKLVRKYLIGE